MVTLSFIILVYILAFILNQIYYWLKTILSEGISVIINVLICALIPYFLCFTILYNYLVYDRGP
jgi:hypothetical protein